MRSIDPRIIYEDECLLAVDKPSGWLSIPARHNKDRKNIYHWLLSNYNTIYIVHRLDLETSGIMLFAKSSSAHQTLNTLFENRKITKEYLAFVTGRPHPQSGTIDQPLARMPNAPYKTIPSNKGKPARTEYTTQISFGHFAKLFIRIKTGRTHQIRAHLSFIGHPLMVDPLYGDKTAFFLSSVKKNYKTGRGKEERPLLDRLSLHAHRLSLSHPDTSKTLDLVSELPRDLSAVEKQLTKWDPHHPQSSN